MQEKLDWRMLLLVGFHRTSEGEREVHGKGTNQPPKGTTDGKGTDHVLVVRFSFPFSEVRTSFFHERIRSHVPLRFVSRVRLLPREEQDTCIRRSVARWPTWTRCTSERDTIHAHPSFSHTILLVNGIPGTLSRFRKPFHVSILDREEDGMPPVVDMDGTGRKQ